MSLNNAALIPTWGNTLGELAKFVGGRFGTPKNPHWLYTQGKKIDNLSTQATEGINNLLNHGSGIKYDPTKWHPLIKGPLGFLGVNVKNPRQIMTPQRAAVWAGGALTAHDQIKGLFGGGQPAERTSSERKPDGMTPSVFASDPIVSAQKQASVDIEFMIRRAEENV